MTSTIKSMMFGAFLAAQVEGRDLPRTSSQEGFNKVDPESLPVKAALADGGKEPSKQPLQSTGPSGSTETKESGLAKMKRDRRFPRQVELVIYNTERMPRDYVEDMLKRVFHENVGNALILSHKRHIHEGPFTKDVARTKADSVRLDAERNNVPVPQIRYIAVKRTM